MSTKIAEFSSSTILLRWSNGVSHSAEFTYQDGTSFQEAMVDGLIYFRQMRKHDRCELQVKSSDGRWLRPVGLPYRGKIRPDRLTQEARALTDGDDLPVAQTHWPLACIVTNAPGDVGDAPESDPVERFGAINWVRIVGPKHWHSDDILIACKNAVNAAKRAERFIGSVCEGTEKK